MSFPCPMCHTRFPTVGDRRRHLPVCGSRASLSKPSVPPALFTCPYCGGKYTHESTMWHHRDTTCPRRPLGSAVVTAVPASGAVNGMVVKFKHDSAANWAEANPRLVMAEPGYETDTGRLKVGDGINRWNGLPYLVPENESPTAWDDLRDTLLGIAESLRRT